MNYKTIEQQVIEKADKDLEHEVRQVMDLVNTKIPHYESGKKFSTVVRWSGEDIKIEVKHRGTILQLLKEIMLDSLRETRRKQAIESFIGKVEKLSAAYEQLGLRNDSDDTIE